MLNPKLAFDSSLLNLSDILPGHPIRRETFEALVHSGYSGMALHPHSNPLTSRWYGKNARDIADQALEAGIAIASLHGRPIDLASPPHAAPESVNIDLETARAVHSHELAIACSHLSPFLRQLGEREAVERLAALWKTLARRARDLGLLLVWSLRPETMLDAPKLLLAILAKTDEPNFGIELDVGSAAIFGAWTRPDSPPHPETPGALALLDLLKGNIASVRLSDGETIDDFLPEDYDLCRRDPGAGKLDWSRVIPALLDAWIPSPWWTVEPQNRAQAESLAAFFQRLVTPCLPETVPAQSD